MSFVADKFKNGSSVSSTLGDETGGVVSAIQTPPSVAQTKRASAAPMGVAEAPKRRRRGGGRVSTVLSDLGDDRLGG